MGAYKYTLEFHRIVASRKVGLFVLIAPCSQGFTLLYEDKWSFHIVEFYYHYSGYVGVQQSCIVDRREKDYWDQWDEVI